MSARVIKPITRTESNNTLSPRVFKPVSRFEFLEKLHKMEPTDRIRKLEIARVRRSLFGPINHVETQRFLEEELAKESRNSADKWQFNFAAGKPLEAVNEARFVWEPINEITYAPVKDAFVPESDNEGCYPRHLDVRKVEAELEMETAIIGAAVKEPWKSCGSGMPAKTLLAKNSVQTRMTDFMQERKRSAEWGFLIKNPTSQPSGLNCPSKLKISRSSNNLGS